MSLSSDHWKLVYEPMLNQRLDWVWFYPLVGCDTPEVVRNLQKPVIGYSGAVGLRFHERDDLYLTWKQVGYDMELFSYRDEAAEWPSVSVDRIRMSAEEPWGRLHGGRLTKVELYRMFVADERPITTAAHHLETDEGDAVLWISTASGEVAGSGDDLLVSVDHDLAEPSWFELAVTVQ